jgi:hypothetical protein
MGVPADHAFTTASRSCCSLGARAVMRVTRMASGATIIDMAKESNVTRDGTTPYWQWSTPVLKNRLIDLVREMNVRTISKNVKLTELAGWVVHELPRLAPDDPRTAEAVAIAEEWWQHDRT